MSAKTDFKEAQNSMATAKRDGARPLDLSNLKELTIRPDEISTLTWLTSQNRAFTRITDLSPLANMTALISLDLWLTQVPDLPQQSHRLGAFGRACLAGAFIAPAEAGRRDKIRLRSNLAKRRAGSDR